MIKVFIDGSEGTTGLRIYERFEKRNDIELLAIEGELRKDINERKRLINESDITFLCLPDAASRESVSFAQNSGVRIIDTSTAHRTESGWSYGFPELSEKHRLAIKTANRVAVPGCHAGGFNAIVYPLISLGVMPKDYPIVCFSMTGYSGGGKKMIAEYESAERSKELGSVRQYGLNQQHKHLKEIKAISQLEFDPVFCPAVADYYSGMVVSVPVYTRLLNKKMNIQNIYELYNEHYAGQRFVKVIAPGPTSFIASNTLSGYDGLEIEVNGNDERAVITAKFDNLGKGSSGAAVQCLNIMLGIDEETGLNI